MTLVSIATIRKQWMHKTALFKKKIKEHSYTDGLSKQTKNYERAMMMSTNIQPSAVSFLSTDFVCRQSA